MGRIRRDAELLVEACRKAVPVRALPAVVAVRFWIAWARPAVRDDARRQMAFLLRHARPTTDLEAAARAYVRRTIWRGEMRWHPELLTQQPVEGFEHLRAAHARGAGVVLNFMHHGCYEGVCASIARLGLRSHMVGFDHIFDENAPGWLRQHVKVATTGGNTPVSVGAGSEGIADLLRRGQLVALASDVPGRTPVRFVGRDLVGSFGAARIASVTGSPVIVATSELDEAGRPFFRLHEPLDPAEFASARELLDAMLARHEPVILRWPESYEVPLSRWGLLSEAPATDGAR